MKTKIKNLFIALAMFGLIQSAEAQFDIINNGNGTCAIGKYTGSSDVVIIPDTINNLTVVGIAADAFYEYYSITSVTIPNSVITIESDAFLQCSA